LNGTKIVFWNTKVKEFSPRLYLTALGLLLGLVLVSAYLFRSLYVQQQELINVQETRYNSYLLATQLRQSSNELTRLVRTYAATGNPLFEKQFWEVLSIRNGQSPLPVHYDRVYWDFLAIENATPPSTLAKAVSLTSLMKDAGFTEDEFLLLNKSQVNSDKLVKLEKMAMNVMKGKYLDDNNEFSVSGEPDQRLAIDILHGEKYHKEKISIMAPINKFYEKLDQRTKVHVEQTANQLDFTLKIQIYIFAITISAIFLLMLIANRYHKSLVQKLNQMVDKRTDELNSTNHELKKALEEVKTLTGIIPICSYCHSIRDDEGKWNSLEAYLSSHSDARFSHSICSKCEPKVRLDLGLDEKQDHNK